MMSAISPLKIDFTLGKVGSSRKIFSPGFNKIQPNKYNDCKEPEVIIT